MILGVVILILISAYTSWRYSLTEADPDFCLFNMAAFTGSVYGRDFLDCKTPAIHIWFWLLAKIVGKNVKRVKFAHHFLMGMGGVAVIYLTGSFWNGLAFTVFINSPWLFAFHGNISQLPALGMVIAIVTNNPVVGVLALGLAFFIEPKYILSAVAIVLIKGWYWLGWSFAFGVPILALVWIFRNHDWIKWTWEGAYTASKRMGKIRVNNEWYGWAPWFTADSFLYTLPWIFVAAYFNPDWKFWLPCVGYAVVIGYSKAIRENHMLAFVPWVALAGMPPIAVLALVAWDLVSSGFYLGDIWRRHYGALRNNNIAAREMGEYMRDKLGTLWVNDFHPAVYIYSGKRFNYHFLEILELNSASPERRAQMEQEWEVNPPDWVVEGPKKGVNFLGEGYEVVAKNRADTYYAYRRIS